MANNICSTIVSHKQILEKLSMKVKAIFSDFDGVFTDNSVYVDEKGLEFVRCNRSDGIGISKVKQKKIYFCIISSEIIPIAKHRANKLSVDCFTGVKDKGELIKSIQAEKKINKNQCVFIGNDINDLPAFRNVGLKIAVNDSYPEIITASNYLLKSKGGYGAVREACEYVLLLNEKNE